MTFSKISNLDKKIDVIFVKVDAEVKAPISSYQDIPNKRLSEKYACHQKALNFKEQFQKIDRETASSIDKWRQNYPKTIKDKKIQELKSPAQILKKAKRLKTAIKTLNLAGTSLIAIGTLAGLIGTRARLAAIISIAGLAISAMGGVCVLSAVIVNFSSRKIFREKRIIKSPSFEAFVKKYVITEQFQLTPAELNDAKLHKLYSDWKLKAKLLALQGDKLIASGEKLF